MTAEAEIAKAEAMIKVHKAALESTRAQVAAELAKLEEEGNSSDEERRKVIEGEDDDDEVNPRTDEQADNYAKDWRPRLINFAEYASQAPQVTFPESPFNEIEAPHVMADYGFNRVGQGAVNLFDEPRTLSEVQPRSQPDALTQIHTGSVPLHSRSVGFHHAPPGVTNTFNVPATTIPGTQAPAITSQSQSFRPTVMTRELFPSPQIPTSKFVVPPRPTVPTRPGAPWSSQQQVCPDVPTQPVSTNSWLGFPPQQSAQRPPAPPQLQPRPTHQAQSRFTTVPWIPQSQSGQQPSPPTASAQPTGNDQTDLITQLVNAIQLLADRDIRSGNDNRILMSRHAMQRDLPTFSGEPEEWAMFAASFIRSTQACNFSNDENLSRLQKCLRGKAKDMVQSLLVTPNNVPEIMQTSEFNFGQAENIIGALIVKAEAAVPVQENKPDSLIDFGNLVRNMVATMQNMQKTEHLSNPMLVKRLVAKLPPTYNLFVGK
ncbi:unnamed protein product [Allacma fusca]|uniref:Uncharacterized protein n=1 Tax=Allacma fusca TaxID=39272 RepID=A0A8J2JDI7_9HEXA|nr:unnamed protein product [Allacma fusca]